MTLVRFRSDFANQLWAGLVFSLIKVQLWYRLLKNAIKTAIFFGIYGRLPRLGGKKKAQWRVVWAGRFMEWAWDRPFPMKKLTMFKMVRPTKHFNLNQKVWVCQMTGSQACLVVGKYRGNGRYVAAWVRYDRKNDPQPRFVECEVTDAFLEKIRRVAEK